jgi:hypothetical protein
MRWIILLGTIALGLALGAAYAVAGDIDPHESPYAVLAPITLASPDDQAQPVLFEGRSAATGDSRNCRVSHVRIHHAWRDTQICK